MPEELFEVVDESGKVLGLKPRSEVHAKGLLHKGVYAWLHDEKGRFFIQQRASHKDLAPLKWDLGAAEHLKPGESYRDAAVRGAMEELGVKATGLKKIGNIHFQFDYGNGKDNELNEIFNAGFKGKIKIDKDEVAVGKFVSAERLLDKIEKNPEKFVPWLLACKKFLEKLKK